MIDLSRTQWTLLAMIALAMTIDAAVSIDGAWNHNATFYELNPLLARFNTVETFTVAVIASKAIAIYLVAAIVTYLNRHLTETWGTCAAAGGVCMGVVPVATLAIVNTMI